MRRVIAIGAVALIAGLVLAFCCLAPMPSSCCKGHCAMAGTPSTVVGIAPAKMIVSQPVAGVLPLRMLAAAPIQLTIIARPRFSPIVTTELRI